MRPCRILLVDTAPAVREALRWALEAEPGLEVVGEAGDGISALERARTLSPDVVILDVMLPDLDGYAVARALTEAAARPVVIFLTLNSDPRARALAAASGGNAFVEKGTGWPALIAALRQVVQSPPAP